MEEMVVHVSNIREGGPDPGTDIDKMDSANIKQESGGYMCYVDSN